MDIQARKLRFIKSFLNITDEEILVSLEKILLSEKSNKEIDLKKRVLLSELDFKNGNTVSNKELINKFND